MKEYSRRGQPIPAEYVSPIIHQSLHIFMQAWSELNLERYEGSSYVNVQRISREQMRSWLVDNDKLSDKHFVEEFRAHINALEAVFIPFEKKRRQEQVRKQKAKADGKTNTRQFRKKA